MKILAILSACLLFCPVALPAGQTDNRLPWQRYDAGLEQAQTDHKPLLVQVYADWCRECHRLEAELASHPQLTPLLRQHFVLARLNLGSDNPLRHKGQTLSEKKLAQQLQATWPPMLLFYAPDGRLIGRHIGAASPDEIRHMLEYVLAKVRA